MKVLIQLGKWLQEKRNFMIYSLVATGIPGAIALVWWLGGYGNIWFSVYLVLIVFLGAYLWGLLMWRFFMKRFLRRTEEAIKQRDLGK